MRKTSKWILIISLLVALGFVFGVGRLFVLRFEAGDVYPAYSSLRADPLGTKALYLSLQDTGRLIVTRNYTPMARVEDDNEFTLFCLGAVVDAPALRSPVFLESLHEKIANGARLVLAVSSQKTGGTLSDPTGPNGGRAAGSRPRRTRASPPAENDDAKQAPAGQDREMIETFNKKWRVNIVYDRQQAPPDRAVLHPALAEVRLPSTISWHSAYYFTDLSPAWQVIYHAAGRPRVIERSLGQGTLVLMADTFLLSNEALRDERHSHLLAWLTGSHRRVVFDESHLGLREQPGVALLSQRIRLHWPLAALIVLALLYVWKNAVPFMPPPAEDHLSRSGRVASAKDDTRGLISLLHRSISRARILETVVTQWKHDLPRNRSLSGDRWRRIQSVLQAQRPTAGRKTDPVSAYHTIYQLITEKSDEE